MHSLCLCVLNYKERQGNTCNRTQRLEGLKQAIFVYMIKTQINDRKYILVIFVLHIVMSIRKLSTFGKDSVLQIMVFLISY